MRKLIEMVRLFIVSISIVVALMILSAMTCQAQSISVTQFLNYVKPGNWYDTNGNLVLKIGSDYTINGCKILSVNQDWADTAISYTVRIFENNGYRNMNFNFLSW